MSSGHTSYLLVYYCNWGSNYCCDWHKSWPFYSASLTVNVGIFKVGGSRVCQLEHIHCNSLQYLVMPLDLPSLTAISSLFVSCTTLSVVKTINATQKCPNLQIPVLHEQQPQALPNAFGWQQRHCDSQHRTWSTHKPVCWPPNWARVLDRCCGGHHSGTASLLCLTFTCTETELRQLPRSCEVDFFVAEGDLQWRGPPGHQK